MASTNETGGEPGPSRYERLKAERERQIRRLREYRLKGEFPWGVDEASTIGADDPHFDLEHSQVHRFIGANGALCALANLIAQSGQRDLVDRIARENNGFCVTATKDPEVLEWIRNSGLTPQECILIQRPGFRPDRPVEGKLPGANIELLVDFQKLERERLRKALEEVEKKLREQTEVSLKALTN